MWQELELDIRAIPESVVHSDPNAMRIDPHVHKRGPMTVTSPLEH
jgi:hypothetical protein